MTDTTLPILYSFRRCPYAMRARLALAYSNIAVELREVTLRDKPQQMLEISPKGTVPVLQLADGAVLDESLDIMLWALQKNDPDEWLSADPDTARKFIAYNDGEFKHWLDRYKYFNRYPEFGRDDYRKQGEVFLSALEQQLADHDGVGLIRNSRSIADMAIMPFIRQFAGADPEWFSIKAPYPLLRDWLKAAITERPFRQIMQKREAWQTGDAPAIENWD